MLPTRPRGSKFGSTCIPNAPKLAIRIVAADHPLNNAQDFEQNLLAIKGRITARSSDRKRDVQSGTSPAFSEVGLRQR